MKAIEARAKSSAARFDITKKFYGKEVYQQILQATLLGHFLCLVKIPSNIESDSLLNIAASDGYTAKISEDRGMFALILDWSKAT